MQPEGADAAELEDAAGKHRDESATVLLVVCGKAAGVIDVVDPVKAAPRAAIEDFTGRRSFGAWPRLSAAHKLPAALRLFPQATNEAF